MKRKDDKYLTPLKTIGGTDAGADFDGTNPTSNTLLGYHAGKSITNATSNTVIGLFESQPFLTDNFLATCVSVSLSSNISPSSPDVVRVMIT